MFSTTSRPATIVFHASRGARCVAGFLGYNAGPGYDLTTGLGSIDAYRLVTAWTTGTSSSTTLSANPSTFNVTDAVQLAAVVSGGGSAPPTGTVTFIADDVVLGTATLAGGNASVSAAGILITAGTGTITALYSGDAVYNASARDCGCEIESSCIGIARDTVR